MIFQDVPELLRQFYDQYQTALRTLAQIYGVEGEAVDSLVQETFIEYFSRYSVHWDEERCKAELVCAFIQKICKII